MDKSDKCARKLGRVRGAISPREELAQKLGVVGRAVSSRTSVDLGDLVAVPNLLRVVAVVAGVHDSLVRVELSRERPVKILHISQPTTEGVAIYVREATRAALSVGHDVRVASPAGGDLATWVRGIGAEWSPIDLTREPSVWDVRRVAEARRFAHDVDIVHLHASKAGLVGRLAVLTLGKRRPLCVFMPHGWSWLVGGRLAPLYRAIERATAPLADAIVAVSGEERELATPVLGDAFERIAVIENGVDTSHFRPQGPMAERGPEPLVVCLGRLSRQKGQDIALRALAQMAEHRARLRLVGGGPSRGSLVRLANELGVQDRVDLWGTCADSARHFRAADVVVFPSRWEGLSLSLLEAMACGCAIVATSVAGTRALAGAGVLVEPDDPLALAAALDELLSDPARLAALGAAARERAVSFYDLERPMRELLQLYERLLGTPAPKLTVD